MNAHNLESAKEWFSIGERELAFARLGLDDEQDKFYTQICFMSQQAIEKYLKGYLVYCGMTPEKVHDLGYLCKKCGESDKKFLDFYDDCKIVSQYYIVSRYPVHWPVLTEKQAKEAYGIAESIIDYIVNRVK